MQTQQNIKYRPAGFGLPARLSGCLSVCVCGAYVLELTVTNAEGVQSNSTAITGVSRGQGQHTEVVERKRAH